MGSSDLAILVPLGTLTFVSYFTREHILVTGYYSLNVIPHHARIHGLTRDERKWYCHNGNRIIGLSISDDKLQECYHGFDGLSFS